MVFDFFKKKKEEPLGPDDLVLSKLKPGYLVDYDMKTYRVQKKNQYVWEEGARTEEWELVEGDQTFYLERTEDDGEVEWSLCVKDSIDKLEGDVAEEIVENEDPPEEIVYEGQKFFFDEDDVGEFYPEGQSSPLPFVAWDYYDEKEKTCLTIEQWGETKFDLTIGFEVEEYQFSNILPGPG